MKCQCRRCMACSHLSGCPEPATELVKCSYGGSLDRRWLCAECCENGLNEGYWVPVEEA